MGNRSEDIEASVGHELMVAWRRQVQSMPKGWPAMTEAEQASRNASIYADTMKAVVGMVKRVAAGDHKAMPCKIDGIALKSGVKIVLTGLDESHLNELVACRNLQCMLVFVDIERYTNGMDRIKADADQPELPLGSGPLEPTGGDESHVESGSDAGHVPDAGGEPEAEDTEAEVGDTQTEAAVDPDVEPEPQPPVDNDHVEPGAEQFSEPALPDVAAAPAKPPMTPEEAERILATSEDPDSAETQEALELLIRGPRARKEAAATAAATPDLEALE